MVPFLLYCLAVGAVAVPKINIILALMCVRNQSTRHSRGITGDDLCTTPAIHEEMGRFMMYANLMSGILCAFSSPRLGALSDRLGRKPLIAFSALGMLMGDVISVTAALVPDKISVYWILLEFVIGGLTGAFVTTVVFVQSYATDCTPQKERAKVFSQLHACMYLGMAFGPAAGAFLVRDFGKGDMLLAFYAAGLCHALFIIFVLVGIPESLPAPASAMSSHVPSVCPDDIPAKPRLRRALAHCNIFMPLAAFRPSVETCVHHHGRHSLTTLAAIDALAFGVQLGLPQLLILFSEYELQWNNFETNVFLSITNAARSITLAILLPQAMQLISSFVSTTRPLEPISHRTTSEARRISIIAIRGAVFLDLLGNLGFAASHSPAMFTVSGVIAAVGAPVSPVVLSCMTTYVEPDRVGELFGAIGLLHALSRTLIPPLMQLGYSLTLQHAPHALFWGLSLLFGVAFMASLQMRS